jgi:flagella basal body P-ring formation protein FlgA
MTRLAIVFIVACALLGAGFYVWSADRQSAEVLEAKKKDLEEKMNAKGTVVYAIRDIQEGSVITADALKQHAIEQSKIPQAAVTLLTVAVGKKAKYGISQGQILSNHDLDPKPPGFRPMRKTQ